MSEEGEHPGIRQLRSRVRERLHGSPGRSRDPWRDGLAELREALAGGRAAAIEAAFYALDEAKAGRAVEEAVTLDELRAMVDVLELTGRTPGELAREALALPAEHDPLALRLLVAQLAEAADEAWHAAALARIHRALPSVFSPYGRRLLSRAVALASGDAEELARADERFAAAATLVVRSELVGRLVVDGYTVAAGEPVRVAAGRHLVAVVTERVTHLQLVEPGRGETLRVRLSASSLADGLEALDGRRSPLTGRPVHIRSGIDGREMLYVPPGSFRMGLDIDPDHPPPVALPWDILRNSTPAHTVELSGFYVDVAAVSVDAFRRFLLRGGYANRNYWDDAGWAAHHGDRHVDRQAWESWMHKESARRKPAEAMGRVTWHEAAAWARWAGKRVPTEAQWERAVLHLGAERLGVAQAEWCADTWSPGYPARRAVDPLGRGRPGDSKVIRGTAVTYHTDEIIARLRGEADPLERPSSVGFRTVLVP
ncbi:MAG: SUMF1/EgtB/PvdO family nonheme iron enzyme [Armatimonadetes bacterium]|nr:SUMF1/EgtB/PvdO family nonheme iron enzyme [Armatimonadota bacterium]